LVGAAMAFGITAWGFLLSPQLRKLDRVSDISDADYSLTP